MSLKSLNARTWADSLSTGEGVQIGFSDPVFNKMYENSPSGGFKDVKNLFSKMTGPFHALRLLYNAKTITKSQAWLGEMNSSTYMTWEKSELIKRNWTHGPILLKGIQAVGDAHKAIEHGMDGIIVSNHGGRQGLFCSFSSRTQGNID